ncbi:MAG: cysteine desulfurase NifS [Peptostreptococcaceae bacterium]|nr:cysteine desulfurase NifS [Peptostreptococcaceae bacterium]
MKRNVYLDYSATTPVKKEVFEAMVPFYTDNFGNASSIYRIGREAKDVIDKSRETIAETINASPKEIYFCAGGSEADNWALKGIAEANSAKGKHIITSKIEHHAILHTCEYLEKRGFEVTYLDVDEYGMINLKDLENAIKNETILISIMYVNNEIGTIQSIKEIGKIAKKNGVYFHTDAVQAYGHIKMDVEDLGVDLMTMSSHKIYGPKGIGALYIKRGTHIDQLIHGGAQEKNMRAGTENLAAIVGFGKAASIADETLDEHRSRLIVLRDRMINEILNKIDHVKLNGPRTERHPGNVNFCFEFIEGESLLLLLDNEGIAASSGSACTSGSLDPSHVLMSIGLPHEIAHGSLRLTIGDFTTKEDVDYTVEKLIGIVEKLRAISPLH